MRKALIAAGLLACIAFLSGSAELHRGLDAEQRTRNQLDRPSRIYENLHLGTALGTSFEQPRQTFVPIHHDGNDSTVALIVAVWDSIRNKIGRFNPDAAGSSWGGADLRLTIALMPSQIGVGAASMTVARVQSLIGREKHYEMATHGPHQERLGSQGLDDDDGQVSVAGVTGRSRAFLVAALNSYQDSLVTWGAMPARSHVYANYRMTLGEQKLWRDRGYLQASSVANPVSSIFSDAQAGQTVRQRNDDEYLPSQFAVAGNADFRGFHTIGERFDPFDIGHQAFNKADGQGGLAEIDSVKKAIDMTYQHGDQFWTGFHKVSNDTSGTLTMSVAAFYELTYFIASRADPNLPEDERLRVLTVEQATDDLRAVRDGELVNHQGFTLYGDFTYTSSLSGLLAPLGFLRANGTGFANWYTAANDTFVASGGIATQWKVEDFGTTDTVATAPDGPDSVSYGAADTTKNYVLADMVNSTSSRRIQTVIRTSGCRARALRVVIQTIPIDDPGIDQDLALVATWGQFTEIWEDNVNDGPAAYAAFPALVGGRFDAPDVTEEDLRAMRIRPQFNPFVGDTTVSWNPTARLGAMDFRDSLVAGAGVDASIHDVLFVPNAVTGDTLRALGDTNENILRQLAPFTLRPYWISSHHGSEADWRATYGNVLDITAAGTAGDDHDRNWQGLAANEPRDHIWYVPISYETDYVYFSGMIYDATGSMASAATIAILNISAQPIR